MSIVVLIMTLFPFQMSVCFNLRRCDGIGGAETDESQKFVSNWLIDPYRRIAPGFCVWICYICSNNYTIFMVEGQGGS